MKSKLFALFSLILFLSLLFFILFKIEVKPDGDIVEYYGVTESVLNHLGVNLQPTDIVKLQQYIDSPKFSNPGYYIYGREDNRYPVHFWAYSLLLIPGRLILENLGFNPLLSLPITNLLIFSLTVVFLCHKFILESRKRLLFLALLFFSPLVFYFTWPGPDMWYLCMLLMAIFYAFKHQFGWATLLTALASWHSQPLIILAVIFAVLALSNKNKQFLLLVVSGLISLVPYLYNLYAFNTLTPWNKLQNAYAEINGFGLQNISLWKLFEQFFDPNIGLFWYTPLLLFIATLVILKELKDFQWEHLVIFAGFILTAFFFQTNPAWHYGTTGYGPTRHIIFLLPLLIYLSFKNKAKFKSWWFWGVFVTLFFVQCFSLFFNGYIYPDTTRSLYHTVYARYFINHYPNLYNPTPEIFIDRTLNEDTLLPQTAIYEEQGICKKAYVLPNGQYMLIQKCGFIPKNEKAKLKKLNNLDIYQGIYVNY